MDPHSELLMYLLIWVACATAIVLVYWRKNTVSGTGLVLAYLMNSWLIYWLGASIYLVSGDRLYDISTEIAGLRESLWALIAFGLGSVVLAPLVRGGGSRSSGEPYPADKRIAIIYVALGAVGFVILRVIGANVPTATAFAVVGSRLFLVGVCLFLWRAHVQGRKRAFGLWLLAAALLPFLTIVTQGFLGRGSEAFILVAMFAVAMLRPRRRVIAGVLAGTYLALSIFVTYYQSREGLREVVWGGKPMSDRVERLYLTTVGLEWFDPGNDLHLDQIDRRLNQGSLLGTSVGYLSANGNYAYGDTLWDAVLSVVPRVLWPEKNVISGGGNVAAQYSGRKFSANSSVGIGHVMEFYLNFGTIGVVVGFVGLGFALALIDEKALRNLRAGDGQGFALWMMMGLSFLHVEGNMIQLTGVLSTSLALSLAINHFVYPLTVRRRRKLEAMAAASA